MGRYSPGVLPRNRGQELADKLLRAGETFAQGMRQKKLDDENEAYRQDSLDLQRQRLTDDEKYRQEVLDRQRAGDAANGVIYDPNDTYGQVPAATLNLGTISGAVGPVPDVTIPAGRRAGVESLGNGFTLDVNRTPDMRRRAAEEAEQNRLAAALEAGGVDKGVASIIAQAPNAAQFFLKKPLSPEDEATIRLRDAQADSERAQASYYRNRAGMGGRGGGGGVGAEDGQGYIMSPDGTFITVPGLSPLDAGRITTEYDRGTTMNRQLADALAPPDQRTDLMRYGTPDDSARVAQSDSLRGVVTERMRNRPTIPDLIRPRTYMTGVYGGASGGPKLSREEQARQAEMRHQGFSEGDAARYRVVTPEEQRARQDSAMVRADSALDRSGMRPQAQATMTRKTVPLDSAGNPGMPAQAMPTPGVQSRRGGAMTPNERARAQRWAELKRTYPDMPDADITARVLKEIPGQ